MTQNQYAQGYDAYENGEFIYENPHEESTDEWYDWWCGWHDACQSEMDYQEWLRESEES